MLASPEAPPPTADDKSDHRFTQTALIEQQHLSNAGPRRTSYNLYHHYTHASDVYPEFNWDSHSDIKLSHPVSPIRHQSEEMDKLHNSSDSSVAFETRCGVVSPSPSLSLSDTVKSDGVNSSNGMCDISLPTSHDAIIRDKDCHNASNKRQRSPSLSQLDYRSFDKCPYSPAVASSSTTPNSFGKTGGNPSKENLDLSILPPIVTREESVTSQKDVKHALHFPSHFHYDSSVPIPANRDASGRSSAQISAHEDSHTLQSTSEFPSFTVGEYASHRNSSHPAASISFSSQSNSQPLYARHPHGYLSALPSPVAPLSNESNHPVHPSSYPASPLLTISPPNSATFPSLHGSSFSSLSPQLNSTSNQSRLVSSSSAAPFSHNASSHSPGTSGHNNGVAEEIVPPVSSPVPSSGACATATPTFNAFTTSLWSSVENQAPRRRGKLPSAVTAILKTWLMSHTTHPYPTEEEKKNLCEQTHLTMNQVSNWFINARRRILIPPSSGNSVHEVRQPVRRQAQSQLTRAATNGRLAPPCLTIRHLSPQSMPASPSPGLTSFPPVSATSPNLPNGGTFDFRYPLHPQPTHEVLYHNGSRSVGSLCSSPSSWQHNTSLVRQPPTSPLYPPQASSAVSYYSSPHSAYLPYHTNNHSAVSTPLPSPHYSYSGSVPYPTNQTRLHSPRSHPSTPTLPHSSDIHHSSHMTYITQPSNQSANHSVPAENED